ncbi:hypothetical protein Tco_0505486 [Tanacetum coccineum]
MALLLAEERFLKILSKLLKMADSTLSFAELESSYFYDNGALTEYTIIYSKPKAITPDLPIEEPDNSLSMGDEHLDTIPSVENLVPIPSEFEGISEDTCDVPVCEDPSTFDVLSDHSEILSDSNNDGTSSDDDDFEDIEYVSLEEMNDVDQEEKEIDLDDILQIQDVILREKLLNIIDSFFEESDTSLSYLDNSLPEFEPFSDDTEETRKWQYHILMLITLFRTRYHSGIESNFDPGGGEIVVSQNVEDDDSFTFVIRTFLPFLTYPADSPLLLSTGSEDTIFDPDIST